MGETGRDSFNWIFKDLLLGRYDEVHNKDIYVEVVVLLGLFFSNNSLHKILFLP